jgi:hypothetical protein
MKKFKITLSHDNGRQTITAYAETIEAAINNVLKAEQAPRASVHKAKEANTTHRVKHGEIYANTYKTEDFYNIQAAKYYATRKASELNLTKRRGHHWNDETTFVKLEKI